MVIRSLPGPLFGSPVVCGVVSDDMSNSRERKMITHYLDPIGRDAAQNGLARLDRLRAIVVEDGRPVGMLQARHRVMGDVTHMHELRGEGKTDIPTLLSADILALRLHVVSRNDNYGMSQF